MQSLSVQAMFGDLWLQWQVYVPRRIIVLLSGRGDQARGVSSETISCREEVPEQSEMTMGSSCEPRCLFCVRHDRCCGHLVGGAVRFLPSDPSRNTCFVIPFARRLLQKYPG